MNLEKKVYFCGLLVSLRTAGKQVLPGKFVAAFSNEEEDELGLRERLPQLTEDVMDAQGAICVPAEPWYVHPT